MSPRSTEPLLTDDTIELVMRLLLADAIDRTVACRFVAPWVEGVLPAAGTAESGAQTIHGLDVVHGADGREAHPEVPDAGLAFKVGRDELVRRCERWLATAGRISVGAP